MSIAFALRLLTPSILAHRTSIVAAGLAAACMLTGGCSRTATSSSSDAFALSAIGDRDDQSRDSRERLTPESARSSSPAYDVTPVNTGGPAAFRLGAGDSLGQSVFSHYVMLVRTNGDLTGAEQYASGDSTRD